jgi:hypothetical protein
MITFLTCCYLLDISSHCVLENKAPQELTGMNLDLVKCCQCLRNPIQKLQESFR